MRMISKKEAQAGTKTVYVKKTPYYGFDEQTNNQLAKLADDNTLVTITDMSGTPQAGDITYTIKAGAITIAHLPAGRLLTSPNKAPKNKAKA